MKIKKILLGSVGVAAIVTFFASVPVLANAINSVMEDYLLNRMIEDHKLAQEELHEQNTDLRRMRIEKRKMADELELEIGKIDENIERNKRIWNRREETIKFLQNPDRVRRTAQENAKKLVESKKVISNEKLKALTFTTPERAKTMIKIAEKYEVLPEDLLAICQQEGCEDTSLGDNGYAFGAFQINTLYHEDKKECAQDIACAADFSSERLIRMGYDKNNIDARYHAIRCHNGCAKDIDNHWYPQSVLAKSKNIKPLIQL